MPNYKAVEEYLKMKKAQYFTHDINANKPFKVVLRGLPDMGESDLKQALVNVKLDVVAVFKIMRKNQEIKYRDKLYLVHLKRGSTTMSELKNIRSLHNIVIQWERYKPVHRDVTQCINCLCFGHGARNCHINTRCVNCGGNHKQEECEIEVQEEKCYNCGEKHLSTSRACPKRAEFIEFRKRTSKQSQPKRKSEVTLNINDFPVLNQACSSFPLVPSSSKSQTPSNPSPPGLLTFAQVASAPPAGGLYSMEQLAFLFTELDKQTRACRTTQEQVSVMMRFYYHHGQIVSQNP